MNKCCCPEFQGDPEIESLNKLFEDPMITQVRDLISNTCELLKVCEMALDGDGEQIKEFVANVLCFNVRKDLAYAHSVLGEL